MTYNIIPSQRVEFTFDDNNLDKQWKQVPLYMQPSEIPLAMDVLNLLNDFKILKPSVTAELSQAEVEAGSLVKIIDSIFLEAIDKYIKALNLAITTDKDNREGVRNSPSDPTMAICNGAIRAAQYNINYPIFKVVVGIPLLVVGGIYGYFTEKSMIEEAKNDESSIHRITWIKNVLTQEKFRIDYAINTIRLRAKCLCSSINENSNIYFYNMDYFNELRSLDKLMNSLSKNTPLLVEGKSVKEFLEQKNKITR
jgi:hypothetical protein